MDKEKIYFITGVEPNNEYKYVYEIASNKREALEKCSYDYPDLAVIKIKVLHANPKNQQAIDKAMKEMAERKSL